MTRVESASTQYETFAESAAEYGVTVRRLPAGELSEAVREVTDQPAVATPLPWEDVGLPEAVTMDPTVAEMKDAATGVTAASLAVAEYGSVLLRADDHGSEPVSLFTDRHVAVLREDDIVPDMTAAFEWLGETLRETRDSVVVATGPSATADMGALVQGAHGPKKLEVLVVS